MKKILFITTIFSILLSAVLISSVTAQTERESRKETQQQIIEQQTQNKNEYKWSNMNKNIEIRQQKFEQAAENKYSTYQNIISRLSKTIEKLNEKDIDTANLADQVAELETKIGTAKDFSDTALDSMTNLRTEIENENVPGFISKMTSVNSNITNSKNEYISARNYFRDDITPELKKLIEEYNSK